VLFAPQNAQGVSFAIIRAACNILLLPTCFQIFLCEMRSRFIITNVNVLRMMNAGTLIAGLFLMTMGVVLFLWMQQTVVDCGSFMSQLEKLSSGFVKNQCQFSTLIQIFGGLIFVGGIATTISGAVTSGSKNVVTLHFDNLVHYCKDCKQDLSKEELESHQCEFNATQ